MPGAYTYPYTDYSSHTGQDNRPEAVCYRIVEVPLVKLSDIRYCVRPNSGRIEPGKEAEIQGTVV